jgi:hypothetical protein
VLLDDLAHIAFYYLLFCVVIAETECLSRNSPLFHYALICIRVSGSSLGSTNNIIIQRMDHEPKICLKSRKLSTSADFSISNH